MKTETNSHSRPERRPNIVLMLFFLGSSLCFAPPAFSTTLGYDIIIVAGQSNAVGSGLGPFVDPVAVANPAIDGQIMQLGRIGNNNLQIIPATFNEGGVAYDGLEHWTVTPSSHRRMGLAIPFARRYVAAGMLGANRKVLIIPAAYGGTSILEWLGELPATPALFDDLTGRVKPVLARPSEVNRVVAFLWHQGETDAYNAYFQLYGMDADEYRCKLSSLVRRIRVEFPSDPKFPIIAGGFATGWKTNVGIGGGIKFGAEFENVVHDVFYDRAAVVSTDGLNSNAPAFECPGYLSYAHFSSADLVTLGDRYWIEWRRLWDGVVPSAVPCTLAYPETSTPCPNNLLTNAGFETAIGSEWTSSSDFVRMSSNQLGGRYALQANGVGAFSEMTQIKPVTAGQHYTISGWLKVVSASGGNGFAIAYSWLNSTGSVISENYLYQTTTTGGLYVQKSAIGVVAPVGAVNVKIRCVIDSTIGTAHFDDLSLGSP